MSDVPADDFVWPSDVRAAKDAEKSAREKARRLEKARAKAEAEAPEPQGRQLRMTVDGPVLARFMADWAFVTIIRGPWASGKSVGCIGKLYQAACMQEPDSRGIRRTRWAVVRNTYPDLKETTIKSWLEWFPEEIYGPMRQSRPYQHIIRVPGAPDARGRPTTVEMEVLFLALDDEQDRKKLLSMEFTGAWINEAREIDKGIIDDIIGRTGRFPPKRDGGHTWAGVIMDTNAPPDEHWLPVMMGETPVPEWMDDDARHALVKPDDWHYYVQPGALLERKSAANDNLEFVPNPLAENISNLTDGFDYYLKRKGGKTLAWIRVNFCNQLGRVVAGKPVWPTFEKARHVPGGPIPFDPDLHLYVGIDQTGRNPAAVAGQVLHGRWKIVGELIGRDVSREAFAPQVRQWLSKLVAPSGLSLDQVKASFFRDPHDQRDDSEGQTATMIYRRHGMILIPAPGGNGITMRRETIEILFDNDKLSISPVCSWLIAACEGGYRFRKTRTAGFDVYEAEPDKRNGYADVADALQYMALGAGEGRAMIAGKEAPKASSVIVPYKPRQHRRTITRVAGRRA